MRRHGRDSYKFLLVPPVAFLLAALCWPVIRYINAVLGGKAGSVLLVFTAVLGGLTLLSYVLPVGRLRSFLRWCGAFFYPLFLTALPLLIIEDVLYFLLDLDIEPGTALVRIFGAFILLAAAGFIEGRKLKTRRYTAYVPGAAPCRIALVSDLHLGSFTPAGFGEELAKALKEAAPEAVVIAGDLFDDRFESLTGEKQERIRKVFKDLTGAVPVYACEGNHDILYGDERKEAFIESCGIRMLCDETALIAGAGFLFRRDADDPDREEAAELYKKKGGPAVTVDHSPFAYKEAWENGAFLVLSGHTHAGQTFPATLLYKTFLKIGYGLTRSGDRQLIVTSGAGFCGCPVRLGAAREIALVEILPRETAKE